MRFTVSLKENRDFKRLYGKGKKQVSPLFAVYFRRNGGKESRLGITVGTKLGSAVARNRVRRRIREAYRLMEPELRPGFDIVIVARVRAVGADFAAMRGGLSALFAAGGIVSRPADRPGPGNRFPEKRDGRP